jgi:hypothetical protein
VNEIETQIEEFVSSKNDLFPLFFDHQNAIIDCSND